MEWLKNRLKEHSTWEGLTLILGLVGVHLTAGQVAALQDTASLVVQAAVGLYSLIKVFKKEHGSADAT